MGRPAGTPTVVSIGNSFDLGEGGRWAGNTNDSYTRTDALGSTAYYDIPGSEMIAGCHRSRSAEIHIGANPYGPTVDSINLACSGATTETRDVGDDYKPGIDLCPDEYYCPDGVLKGQATLLHEVAIEHNVDLVVLSIGGNDFEFSSTVTQCGEDFMTSPYVHKDFCHDDGSVLERFTELNVTLVKQRLALAYQAVLEAMSTAGYELDDWTLLVQTYPSPLPPGSDIRYVEWGFSRYEDGGCPFWNTDADWANSTALALINDTVRDAVAELDAPNVAILDVSGILVGHRLCEDSVDLVGRDQSIKVWTDASAADGSEWVAQIRAIFSEGGAIDLPGSGV